MSVDWPLHMRRILARLGEDATFTHGTAQGSSVTGMFLSPYALLPAGLPSGFDSSVPRFAAMTADLPSVAQGDVILRGTTSYSITDVQADDPSGVTVLALQG